MIPFASENPEVELDWFQNADLTIGYVAYNPDGQVVMSGGEVADGATSLLTEEDLEAAREALAAAQEASAAERATELAAERSATAAALASAQSKLSKLGLTAEEITALTGGQP